MTWGTNRTSNNDSGQISLKKYNSEISIFHKELPVSLIFFFLIILIILNMQLNSKTFILVLNTNKSILCMLYLKCNKQKIYQPIVLLTFL